MMLAYHAENDTIEASVTASNEEELRAELLMQGAGLYGVLLEDCRLLRHAVSSPETRKLLSAALKQIRRTK